MATKIIQQLHDHYRNQDNPPAKRMIIPPESLTFCKDDPGYYQAKIIYETDYVMKKQHTVFVKFKLSPNNNVDKTTLQYA